MNRQPLSDEHKYRIGATRLGIPLDEYRSKREANLKWCFTCRQWRSRDTDFARRASAADGLNNECRHCMNPRALAYYRERRRRETV